MVVGMLCFGWIIIWFARTMLTPVYDEIQLTVGIQSGLRMGMIASFYFLGYTLIQIPSGILMDKAGRKTVMIPGLCLFLAGLLLMANAGSIEMIYVGNLLAGLGTGTYYSGAFSLTGETVVPKYKYVATAFVNNGCALGVMAGYLFSGRFVKTDGMSWTFPVWTDAAAAALVILIFVRFLKADRPEISSKSSKRRADSFRIFFAPRLLAAYFYYFSACYGYYMIITWLPSFLETERGITGSASSVYACVVALASIPGALIVGKLADRFSDKSVAMMTALQCLAGIMLFLSSQLTDIGILTLVLGLYGFFGKQAIDPLIAPHVSGSVPASRRSTGLGIFNFFGMSGSVLAPSITGYAEDLLGSKVYGFYISAVLLAVSAVLFRLANQKTAAKA